MVDALVALLRERGVRATRWPGVASSAQVHCAMDMKYELALAGNVCSMLDSQGGHMRSYDLASEADLEALVAELRHIQKTMRGVRRIVRRTGVSS